MAKARVVLNNAGFRALRLDPKVRKFVQEQAERLAKDAGVTAVETSNPRNRARSAIVGPAWKQDAMLMALGQLSGRQLYTTKAGKVRLATDAQVANWTRGRS